MRFIGLKKVSEMMGVSSSSIRNYLDPKHSSYKAKFPKPVQSGKKGVKVLFDELEIEQYMQDLKQGSLGDE